MGAIIDLTGNNFGRLTVLGRKYLDSPTKWQINKPYWECVCLCGNKLVVNGSSLRNGATKSCGCLAIELLSKRNTTHGKTNFSEYRTWRKMKSRCYNPNDPKYPNYGGRGIILCERWAKSFENFIYDMGRKPSKAHSIDRIDNDGIYESKNCRWATIRVQNRNKRNNRWLEYKGKKMVLQDWATFFKINQSSLHEKLAELKSFDKVYEYYISRSKTKWIEFGGKRLTVSEWAKFFKVHRATLAERIRDKKQPFQEIYNFYQKKNRAV